LINTGHPPDLNRMLRKCQLLVELFEEIRRIQVPLHPGLGIKIDFRMTCILKEVDMHCENGLQFTAMAKQHLEYKLQNRRIPLYERLDEFLE